MAFLKKISYFYYIKFQMYSCLLCLIEDSSVELQEILIFELATCNLKYVLAFYKGISTRVLFHLNSLVLSLTFIILDSLITHFSAFIMLFILLLYLFNIFLSIFFVWGKYIHSNIKFYPDISFQLIINPWYKYYISLNNEFEVNGTGIEGTKRRVRTKSVESFW